MEIRKLTKADLDKVRNIEGFPIGADEDIIALSNPPYYTACPNPFIEDFIKEYGKPYDEDSDNYHREPYAADVSEGKSGDLYNMHTYHTKVPPTAILKYITHYTNPGDIIYDAFSGSGMTGVACALSNNSNGMFDDNNNRYCILNDISVAASFISQGYNFPHNADSASTIAEKLLKKLRDEIGWAYKTKHTNGELGDINYIVWSDYLICPRCGEEVSFYKIGIDKQTGHKKGRSIDCPYCKYSAATSSFERSIEKKYDVISNILSSSVSF